MKRMKKCLACILVMALVLSTTCSYAMAASFTDLQDAISGDFDKAPAAPAAASETASAAPSETTSSEATSEATSAPTSNDAPEAPSEPEVKNEDEANAEPEVKPEVKNEDEANAEPEVKPEDEANTEPEVKNEDEANTEPEVKNEDEANTETKVETNAEPAAAAVEAPESNPPANGTYIGTDKDGNSRYGYGWDENLIKPEDAVYNAIVDIIFKGWFGIEAWTTTDGERNVKLNDTVQKIAPSGTDKGDWDYAWTGVVVNDGQKINLDLNGNKIVDGYGAGAGITVNAGGTLTVNDSSNGKGTITGGVGGIKVAGGTVTMNNGTISGNNGYGGVYVEKGGIFNMTGGTIENNKTTGIGGGVAIVNGTFNMEGGTISNNTALIGQGGGVAIKDGVFNMINGIISGNTAFWNGGGVANFGSFTMTGGTITNNKSTFGGGVSNNGTFTMNGGTISNNTANASEVGNGNNPTTDEKNVGGGGGVVSTNTFTMNGGEITGNVAEGSGGGISVGGVNHGKFTMTGGIVSDNTAQRGTGGGITIVGNAEGTISGGSIIGNQALPLENDKSDHNPENWTLMAAGGGIYVEHDATLDLTNVIITKNYASSMGGGLAACPTGRVFVFGNQGAAIYDNEIGENPDSPWGKPDKAGADNVKLFIEAARDIYTVCYKKSDANGGALIGNIMLSNVTVATPGEPTDEELAQMAKNLANWEGYVVMAEDPSKMDSVGKGNNGTVFGDRYVVLTANPSKESKEAAMDLLGLDWEEIEQLLDVMEAAKEKAKGDENVNVMEHLYNVSHTGVLIAGNVAGVGGGIANNGTLNIGKEIYGVNTPDDIGMKKDFVDEGKNKVEMKGGEFSFTLTGGKDGREDESDSVTIRATNAADGSAAFEFTTNVFTKPGTYVFYVSEDQGKTGDGVIYDGSRYKVTIKVTEEKKTGKIGGTDFTVNNLVIGTPEIELVVDKDGDTLDAPVKADGISFTNTKTAENPDPENPDPENPDPENPDPENPDPENPDPEDPDPEDTEDPKNPEEEIPDEEPPKEEAPEDGTPEKGTPDKKTPKAETPKEEAPEAEIPDEDVPLANVPEELTELPDEDVPLADAPKTGDNAQIWGILAVLSGAGLAWLALEEQKRKTAK